MKLRNKILAIVSATVLALVGWAVPAALATGGLGGSKGDPATAGYWKTEVSNAIECYASTRNTTHGSISKDAKNPGVKLVPFQRSWGMGDRWEVLVVHGNNGYERYDLPNANQVYNAKGKAPVKSWIVCKGAEQKPTFTPTCENVKFEFPKGKKGVSPTKGQHINVELSPRGADAGKKNVTLNFHDSKGTWSNPYTATYKDHKDWPGWKAYAVVWVQISTENYHYKGELVCGDTTPPPPVEYSICVWDAKKGEAVEKKVSAVKPGDIEWKNGSECTPPKKFKEYTTYVCWEIVSDDFKLDRNGLPSAGEKLFKPKQEFKLQGNSFAALNDCWDIVQDCESITWFQLDEYKVKTEEHHKLLERLKKDGLGWNASPEDSPIIKSWKFKKADGGECAEPDPVFICEWDAKKDVSKKVEVDSIKDGDVEWVDGIDCGPDTATYCFADGKGGFFEATVRDDGTFPHGKPVADEKCNEPEVEYFICEWDAQNDVSKKVEVDAIGNDDIEWVDGIDCGPGEATYCFADGDGGFFEATVRDDGTFPHGEPVADEKCNEPEVEYFICEWDSQNDVSVKVQVPSIGAGDTEWVDGIDCGPGEATYCFADGNGGFVEQTVRDDDDFPLGEPVADEKCNEPEVEYFICEWDSQNDVSVKVQVPSIGTNDTEWVDGIDCGPSEATYCFADGDGGFVEVTVRDDGDFPLGDPVPAEECVLSEIEVTICAQDGDTWGPVTMPESDLPDDYREWTGNPADCYDAPPVYICVWDSVNEVPVQTEVPSIGGSQIPWVDGTECSPVEEEPQFICVWDAKDDVANKVEVDSITEGDVEWADGNECTPEQKAFCFPDGNGEFVEVTVYVDDEYELGEPTPFEECILTEIVVEICAQDGDTWVPVTLPESDLPEDYREWTGNPADCFDAVEEEFVSICVPGDEEGSWESDTIPAAELTEDMVLWDAELGAEGCDDSFTIVRDAPPLAPAATPVPAVVTYAG